MPWWIEHLILNVFVFLLAWSYAEGDTKKGLLLYLVIAVAFYGFMGLFLLAIIWGGHIAL